VITFAGEGVDALERAFREAIRDYIAFCEEIGKPPERCYSEKIPLRTDQDLHRRIAAEAESEGSSLNGLIADLLGRIAID
jgi:predicted HicB family RNase H-like nuclease